MKPYGQRRPIGSHKIHGGECSTCTPDDVKPKRERREAKQQVGAERTLPSRYDHAYRWSADGPECDICGSVHNPNLEPLSEHLCEE